MRMSKIAGAGALALLLALAGCAGGSGAGGTSSTGGGGGSGPGYGSNGATSSNAALATAQSPLGKIVVNGDGMTLYMFDSDTQGASKSSCTGTCLVNWPPLTTTGAEPAVDGVTGTVGVITAAGGAKQITLDGWPLYLYAGDRAVGDVNGQGVGGTWWVVAPDGSPVRE